MQLELQYADEIKALNPPHTYVPWVVVDGKPIYDVSVLYNLSDCKFILKLAFGKSSINK